MNSKYLNFFFWDIQEMFCFILKIWWEIRLKLLKPNFKYSGLIQAILSGLTTNKAFISEEKTKKTWH